MSDWQNLKVYRCRWCGPTRLRGLRLVPQPGQVQGAAMSVRIHSGSVTERVLEVLTLEGGWWTTSAIHDRFDNVAQRTIDRTLYRLRDHGLIEARQRILNEQWPVGHKGSFKPAENEWRAL